MKGPLFAISLLLLTASSIQYASAQLQTSDGGDCSAYPDFPNQCFGDAGTTYVCCDVQSCGDPVLGTATCASGNYPDGFPIPPGAPGPSTGPQPFAKLRNSAFDPVQSSWCSGLNHVGPLPGYTSVVTVKPNGAVPADWHCFPGCDSDLSYQVDSAGNPYVRLTNIDVSYKAFQWSIPGNQIPVGSQQQVLVWARLGNGALTSFKLDFDFVIDGKYSCAGKSSESHSKPYVVPNQVYVTIQGITGQDLWVYSVSIISVPKNLYLSDLTTRTQAIRKANLNVKVVDTNNKPVPGASVQITQTKTSFPMGGSLQSQITSTPAYQQFFTSLFNTAVFENDMKWYATNPSGPTFNYATPDAMLAWCDANGIQVRGHNIFWDIPQVQQDWVKALSTKGGIPNSDLYKAMVNRLQSIVTHYKGRVIHWDVNNEQFHGGSYEKIFGPAIDDWMYPAVKQIDPNVKNAMNDYNYVEICEDPVAYPELYLSNLKKLTNRGNDVDILAFQGQFLGVEPLEFRARLDKIASAGIPIWMSEVNVNITDHNKRADYLEFIFREAFAHPAVQGFLFWYTTQDQSVYSDNNGHCTACLGNQDYSLNAAGQRVMALKKEFTTPAQSGTTDGSGNFPTFNAYFGTFQAAITIGGKTTMKNFTTTSTPGIQSFVLSIPVSATPNPPPNASPPSTPVPSPAGGTCSGVAGFPNQCYAPAGDTYVCCDSNGCGPANGKSATCADGKYPAGAKSAASIFDPTAPDAPPADEPASGPPPESSTSNPPSESPISPPPASDIPGPAPVASPSSGDVPSPTAAGGICDPNGGFPNQCYNSDGSGFVCCDASSCGASINGLATCASGLYA